MLSITISTIIGAIIVGPIFHPGLLFLCCVLLSIKLKRTQGTFPMVYLFTKVDLITAAWYTFNTDYWLVNLIIVRRCYLA